MGGKMSRDKGKRGERQVIKLLKPIVDRVYLKYGIDPPLLQRNLLQSDCGGFDVYGLDWMALEVKWQEDYAIPMWWRQTLSQCGEDQVPVLFYRRSRVPWTVRMFVDASVGRIDGGAIFPADMRVHDFLKYFELELSARLNR